MSISSVVVKTPSAVMLAIPCSSSNVKSYGEGSASCFLLTSPLGVALFSTLNEPPEGVSIVLLKVLGSVAVRNWLAFTVFVPLAPVKVMVIALPPSSTSET